MSTTSDNTSTANTYNRLENRTRKGDFDQALRAEVRDALWMLTRQWQFGEFQAEDVGSSILARIHASKSPVQKFSPANSTRTKVLDDETPLEVMVEQETPPMDLILRIEVGASLPSPIEKRRRSCI